MKSTSDTLSTVRRAVRSVVEGTPELRGHPVLERQIAEKMVGVSMAAAELLAEEQRLSDQIAGRSQEAPPLAEAQAASDIHGRTAVDSAGRTIQATREAIDFPNFVTSLITGVFQAIQNSSIQQLQAFSELLNAVDSSTSDFATTQITDARAAQWAIDQFGVFTWEVEDEEAPRLVLREDAELPDSERLQRTLDATSSEVGGVSEGEIHESLIPLVKRKLGRERQAMLATMILMGLQRVVVDDGHLHASMRLAVDARSTAEQTSAEQSDMRVETEAAGSFGVGAWGASARMAASVGYVKSDEQFTKEDIAVSAGLRSSVDLRFRTVPLDVSRMTSQRSLKGLMNKSMAPGREQELGTPGGLLEKNPARVTNSPTSRTPAASGSLLAKDTTLKAATKAREDAAKREEQRRQQQQTDNPTNTTPGGANPGGANPGGTNPAGGGGSSPSPTIGGGRLGDWGTSGLGRRPRALAG